MSIPVVLRTTSTQNAHTCSGDYISHVPAYGLFYVLTACLLQSGMARIKANLASGVKKGKMSQEAADKVFGLVTGTLTYDDFKRVDMVIEAAIEVRITTAQQHRGAPKHQWCATCGCAAAGALS